MFDGVEGLVIYAHHEQMDPGFMRLTALATSGTNNADIVRLLSRTRDTTGSEDRHGRVTHFAACDLSLRPWTFQVFARAGSGVRATGLTRPVASWKASTSATSMGLPRKLAPRAVRASPGADWVNAITYSNIAGKAWALWPELLPDNTAVHLYSPETLGRLSGTVLSPFTRQPCAPEIDGVPLSMAGRK